MCVHTSSPLPMLTHLALFAPQHYTHTCSDYALPDGGGAGDGPPFVAGGTAEAFGEDYPGLGRVMLFEVRFGCCCCCCCRRRRHGRLC